MTSPRVPLFQRKGAPADKPMAKPSVMIAIGHSGKPSDENAAAPNDGADDMCTCPQCGCTFNPETGQVSDAQYGDQGGGEPTGPTGGGDLSSKIAAMMGGKANASQ